MNIQLEHSDFQNILFEGPLEQTTAEEIEIDQESHEEATPASEEVRTSKYFIVIKYNLRLKN